MKIRFLFLVLSALLLLPAAFACDYNISSIPYTINQNDSVYCVTADLSISSGTAITFGAGVKNTTLECQGYLIDDTGTSTYGVYILGTATMDNTVRNCVIQGFDSIAIFIDNAASNNYIINNTLEGNNYGLMVGNGAPANNYLIDNIIINNYAGVAIYSGQGNTVTGGTIHGNSLYDYDIETLGAGNSFTGTNFTGARTVYMDYYDLEFKYNDDAGNIWLNSSFSSTYQITRAVSNWNSSLVSWNDTADSPTTATYKISGMIPNQYYRAYQDGVPGAYLLADSTGYMRFDLSLSASVNHEIKVMQTTAPEVSTTCDYNITSFPYTIDQSGKMYCLNQSFSASGATAITFAENTILATLDCKGYSVTGDNTDPSAGAQISSGAQQNTIKNCVFGNFTSGIFLNSTNLNTIKDNTVVSYTGGALQDFQGGAILLYYSDSTIISNNTIGYDAGGREEGINLHHSNNNTITGNEISNGAYSDDGIAVDYSNNNTITYNYIHHSGDSGIEIDRGDYNLIANNDISFNDYAVEFKQDSEHNTVSQNEIYSNVYYGVRFPFLNTANNLFTDNNIYLNGVTGIEYGSDSTNTGNVVSGGTIHGNAEYDYSVESASTENTIISTNFTGMRKLYFFPDSWFSYKDDPGKELWLKTSASTWVGINRTLTQWSVAGLNWTEAAGGAVTMTYNITGLLPGTEYYIYDNGAYYDDYITDAAGGFLFAILISGTHAIGIAPIEPPYPSDVVFNVAGSPVYSGSGALSTSVLMPSFADKINNYLSSCTPDAQGYCDVPLEVEFSGAGKVLLSGLSVQQEGANTKLMATVTNEGLSDTVIRKAAFVSNTGDICLISSQDISLEVGNFVDLSNSSCDFSCHDFLAVRATTSCGSYFESTEKPRGC